MTATKLDVRERAARRWRMLEEERPDLRDAIDLQRALVGRVIDLRHLLETQPGMAAPPAAAVLAKLAAGQPFLRREPVSVPRAAVLSAMLGFCADLAEGGAGAAARHIGEVLEQERIDAASLVLASVHRRTHAIRSAAIQQGLSADLLWIVAELAAGPLAAHIQQRTTAGLATVSGPIEDGLPWRRGDCLACGSWPALLETCAGISRLRCSFCGASWAPPAGCVYCGNASESFRTAAPDPGRPRRLQLCEACGGYLKTIESGRPTPFELLSIEDLATSDLDVGAMERGYRRPALPELDDSGDPSCAGLTPAAARDPMTTADA